MQKFCKTYLDKFFRITTFFMMEIKISKEDIINGNIVCPKIISNNVFHIEFFPGVFTRVHYVLSSDLQKDHLDYLEDGSRTVAIDTEWFPFGPMKHNCPPDVIQLATTKGCLIIHVQKSSLKKNWNLLKNFVNNHKFIEKGNSDEIKMKTLLGKGITYDFENIEMTRLQPYMYSMNFMNMVRRFVGEPSYEFKDKKISKSRWNCLPMKQTQLVYAAFDVASLILCLPNFPSPIIEKPNTATNVRVHSHEHFYNYLMENYKDSIQSIILNTENSNEIRICFSSKEKKQEFKEGCNLEFIVGFIQ